MSIKGSSTLYPTLFLLTAKEIGERKPSLGCSVSYVSALLTSVIISIRCFQTRASRSNMKTRQDTQSETLRYCTTRHGELAFCSIIRLLLFDLLRRFRVCYGCWVISLTGVRFHDILYFVQFVTGGWIDVLLIRMLLFDLLRRFGVLFICPPAAPILIRGSASYELRIGVATNGSAVFAMTIRRRMSFAKQVQFIGECCLLAGCRLPF